MNMRKNDSTADPSARRGWGPFSGGQLTAIAIALLVVAGLPTGAWAAAKFQKVQIVGSGHAAHVDKSGHLQVGGSVKASVGSAVTARTAKPSDFVLGSIFGVAGGGGCLTVVKAPAHHGIVITQVTFNVYSNFSPDPGTYVTLIAGTPSGVIAEATPPTTGSVTVPLGAGYALRANKSACVSVSGDMGVDAFVYGYTV